MASDLPAQVTDIQETSTYRLNKILIYLITIIGSRTGGAPNIAAAARFSSSSSRSNSSIVMSR